MKNTICIHKFYYVDEMNNVISVPRFAYECCWMLDVWCLQFSVKLYKVLLNRIQIPFQMLRCMEFSFINIYSSEQLNILLSFDPHFLVDFKLVGITI